MVWAAVDKALGFTPEGLIAEVRRNSNFPPPDWRALSTAGPVDPITTTARLRAALEEAEAFVLRMPTDYVGLLFLENGKIVQPDPARLDDYEHHRARRRGHWPRSSETMSGMLERYRQQAG